MLCAQLEIVYAAPDAETKVYECKLMQGFVPGVCRIPTYPSQEQEVALSYQC